MGKHMNIITRGDAAEKGLTHYFTGNACKRGHIRERSVSTGACLGCLAHYAKQYHNKMKARQRDAMIGIGETKVSVHPDDIERIQAFADLLRRARIAGTPVLMVPTAEHVPTLNTMIAMLQPSQSAPAAPAPVVDDTERKRAMWTRIHGADVAEQMIASGM